MPVFRRRRGWHPRAAITTLHPKGKFMKAGSAVSLASAAQARNIHQLLHGHAVSLRFCRPVIPSSCQIVLTRHPKTTSCQHKLVTTHRLSVESPCTPSQSDSCSEKPHTAHEVMNQLHTPNPHSVIASDLEVCRSTPPELCLNSCLLNRDRVSKPQTEHKTMSVC